MPNTEYIVEIYSTKFEKIGEMGPYNRQKSDDMVKAYKEGGFLATVTEKEVIDHHKALGEYYDKKFRN
jgi:hypothetical protein